MLYSEQMKEICEKLGVNPAECKDGLYSTLLQTISDACDGGGGSGGGDGWHLNDASYLFSQGVRLDERNSIIPKLKGVTNTSYMFNECKTLESLDVSKLDTSEVTTMAKMFYCCENLTSLDVSNWNTSKVTNMSSMFHLAQKLTRLDVSNFDTSNVTNMSSMFTACASLEEITGFSATNKAQMSIGFPSITSAPGYALKRLTFRTDLPEGQYSIRSKIDIRYCSFEREGMVEMFNTLPDVSGLTHASTHKIISIKGNPCVTNETLTAEDEAIATSKGWDIIK